VQSRRLVIDANILVRAVLGVRARELIERYCESAAFYVAESNAEEAMQYLAELAPKRGIREEVWRESFAGIMAAVQSFRKENSPRRRPMPRLASASEMWPTGQQLLELSSSIVRYGRKMKTSSVPASRLGPPRR
jgi:hypothetical protein